MKNNICKAVVATILACSTQVNAANFIINDLTIKQIRAVGDYQGTTFDNTIEIWFTTTLNWPSESGCTNRNRVYVDAKHSQIISAAFMAFASGKKVNVNVDNALPVRGGSCEVSFLDVVN